MSVREFWHRKMRRVRFRRGALALSGVIFTVVSACALFERSGSQPTVTCYKPVMPDPTPTPELSVCYTPTPTPSATPMPLPVLCYTPTPAPTTTASPTLDSVVPTPSPQAQDRLRSRLIAEGDFPEAVERHLKTVSSEESKAEL